MAIDPHKLTYLSAEVIGHNRGGSGSEDEAGFQVFYVNNDSSGLLPGAEPGADIARFGQSPLQPFATIDYAIGQCVAGRGDKIIVLPGHSETLTSAITMDVSDVTIEGRGRGAGRPQISSATAAIDLITVTAANCKIKNLLFNEVTGAVSSLINVAAADVVIEECEFDLGASNTNGPITWASGARLVIRNNKVFITADGPDEFLSIEAANDGLIFEGNYIDGGSSTNVFDDAAINGISFAPTNCMVRNNVFIYGIATVSTGNMALKIYDNKYLGNAISKAGVPLVIYADPSGSTTSDGTLEDPTTLADAVSRATAGAKILLNPGSYTLTATLALNDANVLVQPVDYVEGAQRVVVTTATADIALFTVTAAGCVLRGLRMTNTATISTQTPLVDVNAGGDQLLVKDCFIDLADTANAEGVDIATGVNDVKIHDCTFVDPNAGESCIVNAGGQVQILRNRFDLAGGDGLAIEEGGTPGTGTWIAYNVFSGDGTDQTFASWQTGPSVGAAVHHNVITEAGTTNNWLGDDADLDTVVVECYAAGGAAGATTVVDPSVTP